MPDNDNGVSRRNVLKIAGGSVAATGMASLAGATGKVEVNVGFRGDDARRAALSAAGGVVREFDSLDVMTIRASAKAAKALERRKGVRYVERNGTVHAHAQTLPWGIDRVDADVVHSNGETGNGADIAILDTGIDSDHPDLQANLGTGKDFSGKGSWEDGNGHGTHCAGIADAVNNSEGVVGVSTEATLHAGKVLDDSGSGSFSNVAAGIEWAADQGYDVASLSLGGSSGSSTIKDAVDYAYNNGVLVVSSAGNSGPCSDCVGYPAAYSNAVAVSSTDSDDSLSSFSSTGPEVELAAPGGSIYSTYNDGGYNTLSGTSMACPHVSGAGAQLMANGATNTEARSTLQQTAEDIGLASNEQGYGLLDVEAAVNGGGGGGGGDCLDATKWPAGTGSSGAENIDTVGFGGQFSKSSADNAYEDFTCAGPITVSPGGSFDVSLDYSDGGYDSHYANVYVDWDQNEDWSTATETQIMANVSDDASTYTATVDVPSDAPTGQTLVRVRLSWNDFAGPSATGEYGEVNDFTVEVQ
ncbi:S8 family peptidase [Halorussus sp. MSC15.2]|uniref:S8 family peptidase n=1 Tax=Halorussus sp. MSC15.2 TaxID=2283638 RepID=UPI0013D2DA42|nr:S8 family peptidase [Halorussus sp. MSC15.2]NEU57914.1 S8 family peptidase [Halorussus sp. MSC15.2]